jgi:hypothetical protein
MMPSKNIFPKAAAILLFCCVTRALNAEVGAPLWVTDKNKAWSEKDWVCVVEQGASRAEAQSAAASSLARVFKMDVKSVTNAMQSFSQSSGSQSSINKSLQQQVDTSSDVAGLMGVVNDFWQAPDGSWYAAARMNRNDGTAAYSSIVRQNNDAIETLLEDAAGTPATFEAFQALAFAYDLATLNDNYMTLLSVLNNSARQSLKVSYGNAAAVRALMQKAASEIVIAVEVSGDQSGNISKAFAGVFSKRKFKTSSGGAAPYTLLAEFSLFEEESPESTRRVRYLINAVLEDYNGEELLSFTENKRVTSTTESQAIARAVRDAEKSITETGFAKNFDQYLASLMAK